jgi:hypothetical protein
LLLEHLVVQKVALRSHGRRGRSAWPAGIGCWRARARHGAIDPVPLEGSGV